jgi:hypothetical protein
MQFSNKRWPTPSIEFTFSNKNLRVRTHQAGTTAEPVAKLLGLLYLCEHPPYRGRDPFEHTARVLDELLGIAG